MGGPSGQAAEVEFVSGARTFRAQIPSNQLWVSIKDVLVYEEYEFLEQFRLSRLERGATVIDLGANVGLFSLKASPFAGRIVAVEPDRSNFGYLSRNVTANRADNIEMAKVAVSSSIGTQMWEEAGTLSSLSPNGDYPVRTTTLDELVSGVKNVDLLKFDIEGAEYEAFGAASDSTLERVSRMAGEIHVLKDSDAAGLRRLTERLVQLGFHVQGFWSPFQPSGYGLYKPWHSSLKRYNGRNPIPYRFMLSALYGLRPISSRLAASLESGSVGLLFAYRDRAP